ncbi:MAG: type 4a pilus biogenesis protein PilO [Chromatiaceae bacterium]|nr:type 4a pilus biogenesis protein PilO [Gammaproteobacteria bacterium]MCP5300726.1 type 4a pilus biogenesis protein PilO [Chromatiaceae bacterium]MCP5422798.1 type 4a pilus biogenesis protein PilO [Chromatiaceae bacterium]
MNLQDLNELDFSNIGDWPALVKAILVLILCALVGVGWYFYDIEDQYKDLERKQKTESDLRLDFETKQAKAANLDAYRAQLAEMKESFGAMLRQLPNKTEVADLLVDVSQTGLAAGLEFELFQPQGEVPKDFYAELPIKIRVLGKYHEFGEFVSGLAALPRIVTIHDAEIKAKSAKESDILVLEATARTYRYLDEAGE